MSIRKHPLYNIWIGMKCRCYNKNSDSYKNYGGRGIKVCKRWRESFENFSTDMGRRPSGKTLDRINNNKGYLPSNCRWASKIDQARNTRKNRKITFRGKVLTLSQWAEKINISSSALAYRLRHKTIKKALTEKVMITIKNWDRH